MEVKRSFYSPFSHEFEIKDFDYVSCNFCKSDEFDLIGTELEFEIRQCRKCRLVYIYPQPTTAELDKLYEDMYAESYEEVYEKRSVGAIEKHLASIVKSRCPEGGAISR